MEYKYIVNRFDDVIFIGTVEECLAELNRNPEAVAIRDTRYRKNAIEKMTTIIKTKKPVYTREVARDIIEKFENLLEENNIYIPDEDREGDEDEAAIYGMTFAGLLEEVEDAIGELLEKKNVNYIKYEWNGGDWIGE